MRRLDALLAVAVLVAACGERPPSDSLFPLDEGRSWRYRVETTTFGETKRSVREVRNVGVQSVDDERYFVRRWSDGVDYYFSDDDEGIARRALRTFIEPEPRRDPAPRYVLRRPVRVEQSWTHDTHPFLMWRSDQPEYDYMRLYTLQMNYFVESMEATVTVPAGRFENTVLIVGEAALDVYTDPVSGVTEVPVVTREWYAPGVGLVKAERVETIDTAAVKGGSWRMELLEAN